jgi:hypothetical protein
MTNQFTPVEILCSNCKEKFQGELPVKQGFRVGSIAEVKCPKCGELLSSDQPMPV